MTSEELLLRSFANPQLTSLATRHMNFLDVAAQELVDRNESSSSPPRFADEGSDSEEGSDHEAARDLASLGSGDSDVSDTFHSSSPPRPMELIDLSGDAEEEARPVERKAGPASRKPGAAVDDEFAFAGPDVELKAGGNFRFHAAQVFLTYARCDALTFELISAGLAELRCQKWLIGREMHFDGAFHFHVYAWRDPKFDTENVRFFDIAGFHPNIRSVRNYEGCLEYVSKDGDTVDHGDVRMLRSSRNYLKRKADLEAFINDNRRRSRKPVETSRILLPSNGGNPGANYPKVRDLTGRPSKKRHVLLYGPASTGKSTDWFEPNFSGSSLFMVPPGANRWDNYAGESFIVFDDVTWPSKEELCTLTNVSAHDRYLSARYTNKLLRGGSVRQVLMIFNTDKIPASEVFGHVTVMDEDWFKERFICQEVIHGDIPRVD